MNLPSIIIIGSGGHAASCIDVLELHGGFKVSGLVGVRAEVGRLVLGYKVLGSDEMLPILAREHQNALITVGQIHSPDLRISLFGAAVSAGFSLPPIISPRAYVSPHARLGAGTIVMHGAIVNAGAKVGANCIINSRALIEHGVDVGDHCHIATSSTLNGGSRVGPGSFIGSGSTVREGVVIGANCLVGMGCCIRKSLADETRFTGVSK